MRRAGSSRLEGYAVVAAAGLVAALALRRPELAAAAAPFALVLVLGTALARDPKVDVRLELSADRTLERRDLPAELVVRAEGTVDRLELLLDLPPEVVVAGGEPALALRLRAGEERLVPLTLRCVRWGLYDLGRVEMRARDAWRLVVWERRTQRTLLLKAYPEPASIRRILSPRETQAFAGSEVARVRGDGIEYADIRDYVPGDRVRSINWRASARRADLVVNERHPERNTDVVLLVDSFADVQAEGRSTLEDAVRAAAALTERYLDRRDRVGLVSFGGILRWLQPGMGVPQRYRIVETLLETDVQPTYTWRDINLIPARILPPKALVVALTPLVDQRFVAALEDLRARGFDLVVLELDPEGFVRPGRGRVDALAHRLWLLEREVLRSRLERLGIGVARVGDRASLEVALEEVRTYRRRAGFARV